MSSGADERLLTFEVGGAAWALPIAGVVEVAEVERVTSIPTLPADLGGVVNFHGDALPVLRASTLLGVAERAPAEGVPAQVLAITDRPSGAARLGLPIDRVGGLVRGAAAVARGRDPVAERRSIDGRVTGILDPRRLVEQAREAIGRGHQRGEA